MLLANLSRNRGNWKMGERARHRILVSFTSGTKCVVPRFRGRIVGCILVGAPARAISARDRIRCNVASLEYEGRDARARVHITARFFDPAVGEGE